MDMERQDNKALLAEELLAVSLFHKNLYFPILKVYISCFF